MPRGTAQDHDGSVAVAAVRGSFPDGAHGERVTEEAIAPKAFLRARPTQGRTPGRGLPLPQPPFRSLHGVPGLFHEADAVALAHVELDVGAQEAVLARDPKQRVVFAS